MRSSNEPTDKQKSTEPPKCVSENPQKKSLSKKKWETKPWTNFTLEHCIGWMISILNGCWALAWNLNETQFCFFGVYHIWWATIFGVAFVREERQQPKPWTIVDVIHWFWYSKAMHQFNTWINRISQKRGVIRKLPYGLMFWFYFEFRMVWNGWCQWIDYPILNSPRPESDPSEFFE